MQNELVADYGKKYDIFVKAQINAWILDRESTWWRAGHKIFPKFVDLPNQSLLMKPQEKLVHKIYLINKTSKTHSWGKVGEMRTVLNQKPNDLLKVAWLFY